MIGPSRKGPGRLRRLRTVSALAAAVLVAAACSPDTSPAASPAPAPAQAPDAPAPVEPYYKSGDLVEVIVPFSEGGGTDVLARTILPFLGEEMGGIQFVVVNRPGGGSITGVNEFARTPKDGYNMLFHSASSQIPGIIEESGVAWSFGDQTPVAGFPLGGVIVSKVNSKLQTAADFAKDQRIVYAGQAAAGGELRILLLFEMFGTDVNTVLGYGGSGAARLAWEQGESDLAYETTPGYIKNFLPGVEAGETLPLMTFGFVGEDGGLIADPAHPGIPDPAQVYQEVFGRPISTAGDAYQAYLALLAPTISLNKSMVMHADAPPQAIAEVREAWARLLQRADFMAAAESELGGYPILIDEELDIAWEQMVETDIESSAMQWLLNWVQTKYDVNLRER